MTSLFEFAEVPPRYEMPVELLANGARGVAALRFAAVEEEQDAMPVAEPSEERLANERAQQMRVMIDAAREETAAEVRRLSSLECDEMLRTERQRVSRVCGEFARDRQRYFAAVLKRRWCGWHWQWRGESLRVRSKQLGFLWNRL